MFPAKHPILWLAQYEHVPFKALDRKLVITTIYFCADVLIPLMNVSVGPLSALLFAVFKRSCNCDKLISAERGGAAIGGNFTLSDVFILARCLTP